MVKYEVVCDKSVTLKIMGRNRTFNNGDTCKENAYTKNYPKYFRRIGEMVGYDLYLATPTFIPDKISDFLRKEEIRRAPKKSEEIKTEELEEIKTEELIEEKAAKEQPKIFNSIEDLLLETADEDEVIFETEE